MNISHKHNSKYKHLVKKNNKCNVTEDKWAQGGDKSKR